MKREEIKNANNSFNSSVYIISDENNKYILKISKNKEKHNNECKYYNYLYNYVPTSKVLESNIYNGFEYNIITFFNGKNIYDENGNSLSNLELYNIGALLGKMHNCKIIDEDNESWINYLLIVLIKYKMNYQKYQKYKKQL